MDMRIKAVIFDLDGVIIDSEKLSMECWQKVAKKHNFNNIEEAVYSCIGYTYEDAKKQMQKIYGDSFDFDGLKKEKTRLYKQLCDDNKLLLKPGVITLLTFLKENHILVGLATSSVTSTVNKILCDYGLTDFFDTAVCGDMVERGKPAPDVYLDACDRLEYRPEECLAIEDSYNGILAAKCAGMKVIMVPDLLGPEILDEKTATIVKSNLMDVKEYLSECCLKV